MSTKKKKKNGTSFYTTEQYLKFSQKSCYITSKNLPAAPSMHS